MPIYEYECRACGSQFELLVLPATKPACPSCQSDKLERMLSMFAVSSESTRQANLAAGRKAKQKEWRDQKHAEIEMIEHHDH